MAINDIFITEMHDSLKIHDTVSDNIHKIVNLIKFKSF